MVGAGYVTGFQCKRWACQPDPRRACPEPVPSAPAVIEVDSEPDGGADGGCVDVVSGAGGRPPDAVKATLDVEALFPNSMKVTGIKHVCDNLVGALLENLPQPLMQHCDFSTSGCCLVLRFLPGSLSEYLRQPPFRFHQITALWIKQQPGT